jgi:hypothetical protein
VFTNKRTLPAEAGSIVRVRMFCVVLRTPYSRKGSQHPFLCASAFLLRRAEALGTLAETLRLSISGLFRKEMIPYRPARPRVELIKRILSPLTYANCGRRGYPVDNSSPESEVVC